MSFVAAVTLIELKIVHSRTLAMVQSPSLRAHKANVLAGVGLELAPSPGFRLLFASMSHIGLNAFTGGSPR